VPIVAGRGDHGAHATRPVLLGGSERAEPVRDAVCGVVDQDIDRTQRLLDPVKQPWNGLRVGEIDLR
jgi:hypothetical protein